jgi:hypothetical protein
MASRDGDLLSTSSIYDDMSLRDAFDNDDFSIISNEAEDCFGFMEASHHGVSICDSAIDNMASSDATRTTESLLISVRCTMVPTVLMMMMI